MAETIADLLGGVCGMLLASEIVSIVGSKGELRLRLRPAIDGAAQNYIAN